MGHGRSRRSFWETGIAWDFRASPVNQRANVSFSVWFGSPDVTLNETYGVPKVQESGLRDSVEEYTGAQNLDQPPLILPILKQVIRKEETTFTLKWDRGKTNGISS